MARPTPCNPSRRLPEIDRLKGILIAMIVLGHNTTFSASYPTAFDAFYNFHVACFLLLPFIFCAHSGFMTIGKDRLARYLVPHTLFFLLACALYLAWFVPKDLFDIARWLVSVLMAALLSTEGMYHAACGFRLFWFLPALLALAALLSLYGRAGPSSRRGILALTLLGHGLVGFIPRRVLPYVPVSLPLVLFLFPVGLAIKELWNRHANGFWLYPVAMTIFILCAYIGVSSSSAVGLAGDLRVPSISNPARLAFHDVYLLAAFFALLGLSRAVRWDLLAFLGRRSLYVFLAHSFVWQSLVRAGWVDWMAIVLPGKFLLVAFSYLTTLLITVGSGWCVERSSRMQSFLFPGGWEEWKTAVFAAAPAGRAPRIGTDAQPPPPLPQSRTRNS